MVLGVTLFSPALILLTPEHQCKIMTNVTEGSPLQKGACYLQYPSELNDTQLVACPDGWEYKTVGLFRSAVEDVRVLDNFLKDKTNNSNILDELGL